MHGETPSSNKTSGLTWRSALWVCIVCRRRYVRTVSSAHKHTWEVCVSHKRTSDLPLLYRNWSSRTTMVPSRNLVIELVFRGKFQEHGKSNHLEMSSRPTHGHWPPFVSPVNESRGSNLESAMTQEMGYRRKKTSHAGSSYGRPWAASSDRIKMWGPHSCFFREEP